MNLFSPVRVMVLGGVSALAGFLLLYTPLLLDYRGGTLSDVHSMCSSGIGAFARVTSSAANGECGSIGNWYAFGMFLLWAGLAAAAGGVIWHLARRRPARPEPPEWAQRARY